MKTINRRGIALVMGVAVAAMIAACNMADSFSGDDDVDDDSVTSILLDRQSLQMEVGGMDIAKVASLTEFSPIGKRNKSASGAGPT